MPNVITPTFISIPGQEGLDGYRVTWATMQNGDTGAPVGNPLGFSASATTASGGGPNLAGYADKTFQAEGTFGSGGHITIEGTNDATNWHALTSPDQVAIDFTAAALKSVTEAVIWVRPHVTAGDGTTSITATVFFRKTQAR